MAERFGSTSRVLGQNIEVEADETFVSGITKNMHKDRKLRLVKQGRHAWKHSCSTGSH